MGSFVIFIEHMRCLSFLTYLLISLASHAQTINELVLMDDETYQQLHGNETDPCTTAEEYKHLSQEIEDSTIYFLHIAEQLSQKCEHIDARALLRFDLGKALAGTGNHEMAIDYLNLALNDFSIIQDTNFVAKTYKAIGVNYKRTSKYIEALKSFNAAAHYFHLADDQVGSATIELNIGTILKKMNRYDEAKLKYHSALDRFQKLGKNELIADCQNNLGNVFKNEENYDSAFYYMYLTLASREAYGPQRKLGYIYHNLANIHLQTNELDSAVWYIDKSIALKKLIGNDRELASDYFIYGDIYMKQGNFHKAVDAYQATRTLKMDTAVGDIDYEVSLRISEAYYALGDYKNASANFVQYFDQCERLKIDNDPFAIESQLSSYEFLKDSIEMDKLLIESELQELKYRNKQLANQTITNQLYFIIGILGLLILMIVLLVISFRKRLAQAREHRSVLAEQNEELKRTLVSKEEKETLLKEIHHRVKNNLQIISSLIRLQSGYINENNFQERLNEIENRILSMALVHEKLYQSSDLSRLEVKTYIRDLCINILESYEGKRRVKFGFEIDQAEYSIDTLIPLGLILNETISNALKHAFHGRDSGFIQVILREQEKTASESAKTILLINDDGIGADLTVDELKEDSLGMDLIFSLTEQLDGTLTIDTKDGFAYKFTFPKLS